MSLTPPLPTWTPSGLDFEKVATCSHLMIEVARQVGFTRETYVAAVAQLAESVVGHAGQDDIDGEVLRFVGERFQLVAETIARSVS